MAVDTSYTAKSGAPALLQKVQVYQAQLDFTSTGDGNLAADAWWELFDTEVGDVVLASVIKVETVDAGGGTLQVGLGGGLTIQQATAISSAATIASNVTTPIEVDAGPITLCAKTAAVTTAKVTVTVVVLKAADFR